MYASYYTFKTHENVYWVKKLKCNTSPTGVTTRVITVRLEPLKKIKNKNFLLPEIKLNKIKSIWKINK